MEAPWQVSCIPSGGDRLTMSGIQEGAAPENGVSSEVGVDLEQVVIFDTTMRDGEQSPGASMTLDEKLEIALLLEEMGVDVIEAGFAIASKGDFEAITEVSKVVKNSVVGSLARSGIADIDRAHEALIHARHKRIHTFIATSEMHMRHKLQMDPEEVHQAVADSVTRARNYCDDVEWSPEDATRTDHDFLCKTVETAIRCGARTINIPDTVGYTMPDEFTALVGMLRNRVPNIDKAILSVHCHNDLGMAVANSLAAVKAGARQVECTINGLGERAGNAAMEEIVMALSTRNDLLPYSTNIQTENIMKASRLVSAVTGFVVQPNKAVVGANAFAHEAGIHQDGMLKHTGTYEIMTPESVGLSKSSLVMGKHSGRHAFKKKLGELGYELGDNALNDSFARFKDLADKKKEIFDEDLIALVDDAVARRNERIRVNRLHLSCGTETRPRAELELEIDGVSASTNAEGDGPVDAVFKCIGQLFPHQAQLQLFQIQAVTKGTDAQAEVVVRLEENGRSVNGHGADTDTMVASARAYVNALNKLLVKRGKSAPAALSA